MARRHFHTGSWRAIMPPVYGGAGRRLCPRRNRVGTVFVAARHLCGGAVSLRGAAGAGWPRHGDTALRRTVLSTASASAPRCGAAPAVSAATHRQRCWGPPHARARVPCDVTITNGVSGRRPRFSDGVPPDLPVCLLRSCGAVRRRQGPVRKPTPLTHCRARQMVQLCRCRRPQHRVTGVCACV